LSQVLKARLVKIEDGSHGIPWTHAEIINNEILEFMNEQTSNSKSKTADYETELR
jgi:pimeloyl-ACP methyl ester carboxylesterase